MTTPVHPVDDRIRTFPQFLSTHRRLSQPDAISAGIDAAELHDASTVFHVYESECYLTEHPGQTPPRFNVHIMTIEMDFARLEDAAGALFHGFYCGGIVGTDDLTCADLDALEAELPISAAWSPQFRESIRPGAPACSVLETLRDRQRSATSRQEASELTTLTEFLGWLIDARDRAAA